MKKERIVYLSPDCMDRSLLRIRKPRWANGRVEAIMSDTIPASLGLDLHRYGKWVKYKLTILKNGIKLEKVKL